MGKKVMRKLTAAAAVLSLLACCLSTEALSAHPEISSEYGFTDPLGAGEAYFGWYGDDGPSMGEYEWPSISGDVVFRRLAGNQRKYLEDLVITTGKYLGLEDIEDYLSGGSLSFEYDGSGGDIVSAALSQTGTAESPLGSNNVKYNTWYYGRQVSGSAYPWCCVFVMWCADQCGYLTGVMPRTASCTALYSSLVKQYLYPSFSIYSMYTGSSSYVPVPGDLMFFSSDSSPSAGSFSHVGIVAGADEDGKGWYTVEGNSGDSVRVNRYTLSSSSPSSVKYGYFVHVEYPS